MEEILEKGHTLLKKYRVIAILIIFFFAYQTEVLTSWYMENYGKLQDWQNAPVIGLITAYIGALKFALDHILKDSDEADSGRDGG